MSNKVIEINSFHSISEFESSLITKSHIFPGNLSPHRLIFAQRYVCL